MEIHEIAKITSRHYNPETRKIQLQSEMDSLDIPPFVPKYQRAEYFLGLTKLIDYVNALAATTSSRI